MKKPFLLVVALLFAAFAYLNLNDPDPIAWVAAYGATAALFALAAFGRADRRAILVVAAAQFIWMCTMITGMVDWARMGFPSITGSMQAHEPHIEVVREFLGLLISVAALSALFLRTPKRMRAS